MSLINDALKRAKESHQQNSPTPAGGAPMRPAESAARGGATAWLWLTVIILLVGFGAFLIGQSIKKPAQKSSTSLENVSAQQPVQSQFSDSPASAAPKTATTEPTNASAGILSATNNAADQPSIAPAKEPMPTAVATLAPATTLKLQSIVYNPQRPSVMINGKFLFTGDSYKEFRITDITPNSATLISASQTNVLFLEN